MALVDSVDVVARAMTNRIVKWQHSIATMSTWDPALTYEPLPVKRVAVQATGVWLATRIMLVLITLLAHAYGFAPAMPTARSIFPANPGYGPLLLPLLTNHPLLASWDHWDASWYLLIGTHGYDIFTAGSSDFFPMYPLQIHLLTLVFGQQALLPVALALSNLATLAAFIGLGLLAAHEESSGDQSAGAPARLIMITAAYPFAFFLFAPFTEGFFLACVVFSFLSARKGWWKWAVICGFLAGLTRPTAIALVPALAWEYGRQHGVWRRASWRQGAWRSIRWLRMLTGGLVVAGAVPFGLSCYLVFLKLHYGSFLMPIRAQVLYHGHQTWAPWKTLAVLFQHVFSPHSWTPPVALLYLDGGLLILFLVITLLNVHRLPLLYTLYMLATFYLLLTTPIPHRTELIPSAGRYLLMSVPVFLLFSRWTRKRPWLEAVVIGGGFMLQALFVLFFLTGAWIE
jgi:hypothetical protein